MEDGLSSFAQENADFDLGLVSHEDAHAEDPADILEREKQLDENLENALNNLSDDEVDNTSDDDSDNSDDNSEYSDEESEHSHHSQSEVDAETSSVKESCVQPNQHSELARYAFPQIEQHSDIIDSDAIHSKTSDVNCSKIRDVNFSSNSNKDCSNVSCEKNHSRNLDVNFSENGVANDTADVSNSNLNSYVSDVDQSDVFSSHRSENQVKFNHISEANYDVIINNYTAHSFQNGGTNESEIKTYDQPDYGDVPSRIPVSQHLNTKYDELYEEYQKLQELYNSRGQILQQIKRQEVVAQNKYEEEIHCLKNALRNIEEEKQKLVSSLQEAQNTLSDTTHRNNVLQGKLTSLEIKFAAETDAREAAQANLNSAEVTIQSLEQQIKGLTLSDNTLRLQKQNENVVKDLKLRHEKEILKYKENIDKLQENLNAKSTESENLESKLSQLEQKYRELQAEKDEVYNRLSASQKEYQKLCESGNTTEIVKLRLHLHYLQEEKAKSEKQNSDLKDEVKALKRELETLETIKTFTSEKESLSEKNRKGQNSHNESYLKAELQKSHQNTQLLRNQNNSMKEKLEDMTHKLSVAEERVKLFESHYKESETKLKELQKKLNEVLPSGSIPVSQHEKEVESLKIQLEECRKELQVSNERLETLSSSKDKLHEENQKLKRYISEISKKYAEEKHQLDQFFEAKYFKDYEEEAKKLKEGFDIKMKVTRCNYENKITELQKEISNLQEAVCDAQNQYLKQFEQNKSLQSQINSTHQTKEREEIEREIRLAYEKKLNKMKEQFQKEKIQLESDLEKNKNEKLQQELIQKLDFINKFIEKTKQELDEKYNECVSKAKQEFEEKYQENINTYENKLKKLRQDYQAEKESITETFEKKIASLESTIKELQKSHQDHQAEKKFITETFEKKIASLENEKKELLANLQVEKKSISEDYEKQIAVLKDKNNYDFELKAEKELLHSQLKQEYEEKKKKLKSTIEKMKEKYEKHEKFYEDKIVTLENEIKSLKEIHIKQSNLKEMQIHEAETNAKLPIDKEKLELIKEEHLLKDKLSTAIEDQKGLYDKNKKLKKFIANLQKTHKQQTDTFQKENEELKKQILDKENELQLMKAEFDKETKQQKPQRIRNSTCQTEVEVVPRSDLLNLHAIFMQYLKKISDNFRSILVKSRKHTTEQLRKILSIQRDYLISSIFQDLLKDASSSSPNIDNPGLRKHLKYVASSNDNLSPHAVQHQLNSFNKIANSTPVDTITSGNPHTNLKFQLNNISNVRGFRNIRSTSNFDDISSDYMASKMCDQEQTSAKLFQPSVPGGLFH